MMIRYYYAYATLIDRQIGRMLAFLEESGLLDRTVIVFSADHGQTLGSHGGLVDKGWHHFEETHRIPLIIRFPDGTHRGQAIHEPVSLVDLYPTILDLAGLQVDEGAIHGRSLLPLIEGTHTPWRETVVSEFAGLAAGSTTQRTIVWRGLKYGYNMCCGDELYDLGRDPYEMENVIDTPPYQERLLALRRLLAWMQATDDPLWRRYERFVVKPQAGELTLDEMPNL